ncbi:MAG: ABC transporter substrate-binding protein [Chloroflexi bacterium]|nr:ABC transporter substrate-binding protein [Chloroflexota bacterium]
MICPNCNEEIPEGKKFCGHCGHRLISTDLVDREPQPHVEPETPETPTPAPGAQKSHTPPADVTKRGLPGWVWGLVGAVAVVLVLIATGTINIGSAIPEIIVVTEASPTEEPDKQESIVATIEDEYGCDDPIGCVTYGADEPVRIASALVISGPNTDLGTDSQYGVEIAIDFKGDLLGHAIELQAEDDGCSAEGGQTAGQKIVSDPTIIAVVGTSCSGAGVPMSEVISEAGYAMVSPSNTAPSLTDPDQAWNPGYLRTAHNDKVQGKAMADFAYNVLGVTTAAAIHDGDPYTEGLARVFADAFEEIGGTIVEFTAVNKGDTDMRPVLSAVAAAGPPELLYYPVFTAEGGFLTKQAKEVTGLEGTILAAADGMISIAAIEAVGEAGEGMYFSGPDLSFSGGTYEKFLAAYVEKYGSEPISVFHAHSFDAANMIFACVEEVGVQDGDNLHIGRQALRTCLSATSGFEGITGTLTCNEYGDCADPKISVSQLQGGGYVRIWP